jgi:hypothetical protein
MPQRRAPITLFGRDAWQTDAWQLGGSTPATVVAQRTGSQGRTDRPRVRVAAGARRPKRAPPRVAGGSCATPVIGSGTSARAERGPADRERRQPSGFRAVSFRLSIRIARRKDRFEETMGELLDNCGTCNGTGHGWGGRCGVCGGSGKTPRNVPVAHQHRRQYPEGVDGLEDGESPSRSLLRITRRRPQFRFKWLS